MAGFKKGSVDGWDDENDDDAVTAAQSEAHGEETTGSPTGEHSGEQPTASPRDPSPRLPWIHRRSSITDGRENTKQLHLQDSTVAVEREQRSEIESILGESVKKADLREAALIIGLTHVDEVAEQLEEWGYAIE